MTEKYSPDLLAHFGTLCAECETRKKLIGYTEAIMDAVRNPGQKIWLGDYAPAGDTVLKLYIEANP